MNRRKHENQAKVTSVKEGNSIKEIDSIKETSSIKEDGENSSCGGCSETYSNSKVCQNSVDKILSNYKNDIETIKNNKTLYRIEDYPVEDIKIEDIKNPTKGSMKNPKKINQTIIKNIMKLIEDAELDIGFDFEYRNQYNDNKLYITLDYRDYFGEVDY